MVKRKYVKEHFINLGEEQKKTFRFTRKGNQH